MLAFPLPSDVFIYFYKFYLFIYLFVCLFIYLFMFWLRWVFVAPRGLSLLCVGFL